MRLFYRTVSSFPSTPILRVYRWLLQTGQILPLRVDHNDAVDVARAKSISGLSRRKKP
jgi:hypothetical protein